MTVTIARHIAPRPNAVQFAEQLGADLSEEVNDLEGSPDMIDFTFNTAVMNLRARCVIDPEAAAVESWEATVNAMQLGSALFAVSGSSEGTVECRINHKTRVLPATGKLSAADAGNWLNAFWLAVICREQQRMTQLCEIPLEQLRAPEGQYDEYIYHWVDTLQTYWLRRPGWWKSSRPRSRRRIPRWRVLPPVICCRACSIRRSTSSTTSSAKTKKGSAPHWRRR